MTDLPGKVDGTSTVKVQGDEVQVDRSKLVVDEDSIDEGMDQVAALISYWGEMWAAAEQELMEADAHYRGWRAKLGEDLLVEAPKLAEWKVKQAIEASPKFVEIKGRLALAKRNAIMLRAHCDAFRTKASVLQSKGAMRRAEFEATNMTTRRGVKREESAALIEERAAAVKKTFKDRKRS